jgi:cell cycle checkpoint protein
MLYALWVARLTFSQKGLAFLEKSLFKTFEYTTPLPTIQPSQDDDEEEVELDTSSAFQIDLHALLECLQIFSNERDRFGSADGGTSREGSVAGNFQNRSSMSAAPFEKGKSDLFGTCKLTYDGPGQPFCLVLEESGVSTTCELTTYEPTAREDIPLQRDQLAQKIIMRSNWLHDAITELSSTSPTRLTITSSPSAPYFALSSDGPLGSAQVEFSKDPTLLETFQVPRRVVNTYKYSLIKAASRAMAIASKVSIRGDEQGVLSLQFMVEVEGGGVSFVDFRFVPLLEEGEGEGEGETTFSQGGLGDEETEEM